MHLLKHSCHGEGKCQDVLQLEMLSPSTLTHPMIISSQSTMKHLIESLTASKVDLISQGTRFTASCSNYCSNQLREKTTKMNCSLLDHFMVLSFSDQLECQLQTFTHLCHEKPITLQTTALYAHVLQQYCEHFTTSFLIKLSLIAYLSHFTVHAKE